MKHNKKIFNMIIFLGIIFTIIIYPQYIYAAGNGVVAQVQMSDVNTPTANTELGKAINTIIGMIQVAGTGAAIIAVTLQGLKYITAGPNEKADVKKQATPIVIGSILVFATVNIVKIIGDLATKLPSP